MVPDRIFTRYIAKRKKSIDQLWIELLIGNYFRVTSSEIFWGGIRRISAAAGWLCFIF
jgi:hypothetical protein